MVQFGSEKAFRSEVPNVFLQKAKPKKTRKASRSRSRLTRRYPILSLPSLLIFSALFAFCAVCVCGVGGVGVSISFSQVGEWGVQAKNARKKNKEASGTFAASRGLKLVCWGLLLELLKFVLIGA